MPRIAPLVFVCLVACAGAGAGGGPCAAMGAVPPAAVPLEFEGFGFGDLSAADTVAAALRAAADPTPESTAFPLDVAVRGPGGGDGRPAPLAAEIRGIVEGFDVAAGFQGDVEAIVERSPSWTGRIGLGSSGPDGARAVELRTRLGSRAGVGLLGVEVGPRFERRLPNGMRLFLDGAASAEAVRAAEGLQLPGESTADGLTAVGVTARTGLVR